MKAYEQKKIKQHDDANTETLEKHAACVGLYSFVRVLRLPMDGSLTCILRTATSASYTGRAGKACFT